MSRKSKPPIALYSALADITRCRILEILKVAPTPVHVLTEAFSISRPAISRHLRVLKAAGLVAEVKKGRENVYAFRPSKLEAAKTWLEAIASAQSSEVADEAILEVAVTPAVQAPPEPITVPKPASTPKVPRAAKKKPVFADDIAADEAPAKPAQSAPSISQMGFDF